MTWWNIALAVYSLLLVIGGIYGYVQAKSVPSLVGSLAGAFLVLVGIGLASSNRTVGYGLALLASLGLAGFFLYRWVTTGNPMPAVPGAVLSLLACLAALTGIFSKG
ncbi:MAG: TMEM14 family protein [Fimbriimonadales bacterium]|nr:TMEM14 family protein [Fimbriimonadales bacterium]